MPHAVWCTACLYKAGSLSNRELPRSMGAGWECPDCRLAQSDNATTITSSVVHRSAEAQRFAADCYLFSPPPSSYNASPDVSLGPPAADTFALYVGSVASPDTATAFLEACRSIPRVITEVREATISLCGARRPVATKRTTVALPSMPLWVTSRGVSPPAAEAPPSSSAAHPIAPEAPASSAEPVATAPPQRARRSSRPRSTPKPRPKKERRKKPPVQTPEEPKVQQEQPPTSRPPKRPRPSPQRSSQAKRPAATQSPENARSSSAPQEALHEDHDKFLDPLEAAQWIAQVGAASVGVDLTGQSQSHPVWMSRDPSFTLRDILTSTHVAVGLKDGSAVTDATTAASLLAAKTLTSADGATHKMYGLWRAIARGPEPHELHENDGDTSSDEDDSLGFDASTDVVAFMTGGHPIGGHSLRTIRRHEASRHTTRFAALLTSKEVYQTQRTLAKYRMLEWYTDDICSAILAASDGSVSRNQTASFGIEGLSPGQVIEVQPSSATFRSSMRLATVRGLKRSSSSRSVGSCPVPHPAHAALESRRDSLASFGAVDDELFGALFGLSPADAFRPNGHWATASAAPLPLLVRLGTAVASVVDGHVPSCWRSFGAWWPNAQCHSSDATVPALSLGKVPVSEVVPLEAGGSFWPEAGAPHQIVQAEPGSLRVPPHELYLSGAVVGRHLLQGLVDVDSSESFRNWHPSQEGIDESLALLQAAGEDRLAHVRRKKAIDVLCEHVPSISPLRFPRMVASTSRIDSQSVALWLNRIARTEDEPLSNRDWITKRLEGTGGMTILPGLEKMLPRPDGRLYANAASKDLIRLFLRLVCPVSDLVLQPPSQSFRDDVSSFVRTPRGLAWARDLFGGSLGPDELERASTFWSWFVLGRGDVEPLVFVSPAVAWNVCHRLSAADRRSRVEAESRTVCEYVQQELTSPSWLDAVKSFLSTVAASNVVAGGGRGGPRWLPSRSERSPPTNKKRANKKRSGKRPVARNRSSPVALSDSSSSVVSLSPPTDGSKGDDGAELGRTDVDEPPPEQSEGLSLFEAVAGRVILSQGATIDSEPIARMGLAASQGWECDAEHKAGVLGPLLLPEALFPTDHPKVRGGAPTPSSSWSPPVIPSTASSSPLAQLALSARRSLSGHSVFLVEPGVSSAPELLPLPVGDEQWDIDVEVLDEVSRDKAGVADVILRPMDLELRGSSFAKAAQKRCLDGVVPLLADSVADLFISGDFTRMLFGSKDVSCAKVMQIIFDLGGSREEFDLFPLSLPLAASPAPDSSPVPDASPSPAPDASPAASQRCTDPMCPSRAECEALLERALMLDGQVSPGYALRIPSAMLHGSLQDLSALCTPIVARAPFRAEFEGFIVPRRREPPLQHERTSYPSHERAMRLIIEGESEFLSSSLWRDLKSPPLNNGPPGSATIARSHLAARGVFLPPNALLCAHCRLSCFMVINKLSEKAVPIDVIDFKIEAHPLVLCRLRVIQSPSGLGNPEEFEGRAWLDLSCVADLVEAALADPTLDPTVRDGVRQLRRALHQRWADRVGRVLGLEGSLSQPEADSEISRMTAGFGILARSLIGSPSDGSFGAIPVVDGAVASETREEALSLRAISAVPSADADDSNNEVEVSTPSVRGSSSSSLRMASRRPRKLPLDRFPGRFTVSSRSWRARPMPPDGFPSLSHSDPGDNAMPGPGDWCEMLHAKSWFAGRVIAVGTFWAMRAALTAIAVLDFTSSKAAEPLPKTQAPVQVKLTARAMQWVMARLPCNRTLAVEARWFLVRTGSEAAPGGFFVVPAHRVRAMWAWLGGQGWALVM
jgi:hypothetical protein